MALQREPLLPEIPAEAFRAPPARVAERRFHPLLPTSPAPARGLLRRGVLVDKYQIDEVLGVGGFAAVYRATHLLLRMPVAIKLLRQDVLLQRPAMREQLLEEARFTARINHPNVVRIHDAAHSEDLTYIVMEYIDGAPLSRRLQHGPLELEAALRVGQSVASALRAGLRHGLIHRDVKPANILLSHEGAVKLVDFGMASAVGSDSLVDSAEQPLVVGTRGYMSPEQASGSARADFRADIYSLGVTLLEAATGERPRSRKVHSTSASPLPARFAELLRWMQSPAPELRPSSYDVVLMELQGILEERAGSDPRHRALQLSR